MRTGSDLQYKQVVDVKSVLTPREVEYLALVALGYKNNEIAKILYVSYSTVKKTLELIFGKLNAKNRAHAVAILFMTGILTSNQIKKIKADNRLFD